jgi:hypothetical protein
VVIGNSAGPPIGVSWKEKEINVFVNCAERMTKEL